MVVEQVERECFMKPDFATGGVRRVPAFFYVLSLHHRTLLDTVLVQHRKGGCPGTMARTLLGG
jgi:hypothetical protein